MNVSTAPISVYEAQVLFDNEWHPIRRKATWDEAYHFAGTKLDEYGRVRIVLLQRSIVWDSSEACKDKETE